MNQYGIWLVCRRKEFWVLQVFEKKLLGKFVNSTLSATPSLCIGHLLLSQVRHNRGWLQLYELHLWRQKPKVDIPSPPVMLEDLKELGLWDVQEVLSDKAIIQGRSNGGVHLWSGFSKLHQMTDSQGFSTKHYLTSHLNCWSTHSHTQLMTKWTDGLKIAKSLHSQVHSHLVEGVVKWQEGKRR